MSCNIVSVVVCLQKLMEIDGKGEIRDTWNKLIKVV